MAESNQELARAVRDALTWLGATPEAAGPLLGINARTLDAMCQGIVPMRSLIIKFAGELARHCEHGEGAQAWWGDADAWLALAGHSRRRDGEPGQAAEPAPRSYPAPAAGLHSAAQPHFAPIRGPSRPGPTPESHEPDVPAKEYYRPVYERKPLGESFVHVFHILDPEDRMAFERHMAADFDYRAEAAKVKHDLASMSRTQFERKYGRFRVPG